jgi:NADPH-dependent ferric siderophore reductase
VLHDQGIAGPWAERAQPGDPLVIGGPRGSFVVADSYDAYVLIGDETALPAIARWLDVLPDGAEVQAFIEVSDEAERQDLPQAERAHPLAGAQRLPGRQQHAAGRHADRLRGPDGDAFYWIATESRRARMMRKFIEGHLACRATGSVRPATGKPTDETDGD